MHRARQHAETRIRERRHRLAHEAARLMAEGGIRDYQQAKRKAAVRLGIADDASLPGNREIEDALREYQRLFQADAQAQDLRQRREAALQAMDFFEAFSPRLVGPVLEGLADVHSAVALHLHADDPEEVGRLLADELIPARLQTQRIRLDRQRSADVMLWKFSAEGMPFELVVLPMAALRQPPVSGVDDRPMRRASAAQLRQLLADEDIASHVAGDQVV